MIVITSNEDPTAKCDGCGKLPPANEPHHAIMATDHYSGPNHRRRFLGTFCSLCACWTGRELTSAAINRHAGKVAQAWEKI